jgi:hypothetical protein
MRVNPGRPNRPKIHHYVPQLLLREFSFGKKHKLYAYDKRDDRVFITNVDRAAAESGFNDFLVEGVGPVSAEPAFGDLETRASPVLKRIVRDESIASLTREERALISSFVVVQLFRTRNYREMLRQAQTAFAEWLRTRDVDPADVEGFVVPTEGMLARLQAQTALSSHEVAPYVDQKTWVLCKNTTSQPYFTSDNPVAFQNTQDLAQRTHGLAVEGIEIYLPLSRRLMLSMVCRSYEEMVRDIEQKTLLLQMIGGLPAALRENARSAGEIAEAMKTGRALQQTPENVTNQNSLQVRSANRYVYSGTDQFELVRDMLRENPALREGGPEAGLDPPSEGLSHHPLDR